MESKKQSEERGRIKNEEYSKFGVGGESILLSVLEYMRSDIKLYGRLILVCLSMKSKRSIYI